MCISLIYGLVSLNFHVYWILDSFQASNEQQAQQSSQLETYFPEPLSSFFYLLTVQKLEISCLSSAVVAT